MADAEFGSGLEVRGEDRFGHQVLTVSSTAVANGIAAIRLAVRDQFGAASRRCSGRAIVRPERGS